MIVSDGNRYKSIRTDAEVLELFDKDYESLSTEEREVFNLILGDFNLAGNSLIAEVASKVEYIRPIVSVETFLNDEYYLGEFSKSLFPAWKELIAEIFQGGYEEIILGGATGAGKRLPLSAKVLTPKGFKEIRDLCVDDEVCNPDGTISRVLKLHEIVVEDEYIFEMQDGQEIASCKEHLWYGGWRRDKSDPCASWDNPNCIKTTQQIYDHTLKQHQIKESRAHYAMKQFKIPITEAVSLSDLGGRTIDPYLLGYLLGNGTITTKRIKYTVFGGDFDFFKKLAEATGEYFVFDFSKYGKNCVDFIFKGQTAKDLRQKIHALGLLDTKSSTKFIPENYKFAPKEDRLALLQGLMDSDGYVDLGDGSVAFSTTSPQLADDVRWLARSLGCYVSKKQKPASDRLSNCGTRIYKCSDKYKLYIRSREDSKLFRLPRKQQRCRPPNNRLYNIVTGVRIGNKVPMRCITVSHPNGLYLIDDFTVTHNTTAAVVILLRLLYEMSCLTNPHKTYGIAPSDKIAFPIVAVTEQAAGEAFGRLAEIVKASPYFQDSFRPKVTDTHGIIFPKQIVVPPPGSSAQSFIGMNAFSAIIDESNFFKRVQQGPTTRDYIKEIYESIKRRIENRFMRNGRVPGMVVMVSSKADPDAFTEVRIRNSIDNPKVFVFEKAAYEIHPKGRYSGKKFRVAIGTETAASRILGDHEESPEGMQVIFVPEEFRLSFEADLEKSIREVAGYATIAVTPFIHNRKKIFKAVDPTRKHPFNYLKWDQTYPLEINWDEVCVKNRDGSFSPKLNPSQPRFAHFDLSKNKDSTGLALGHINGWKEVQRVGSDRPEYAPQIVIDFILKVIPPVTGKEIVYSELRKIIYQFQAHGFFIKQATSDQFQSAVVLEPLSQQGVSTKLFSVDRLGPYDVFKTALYEERISWYHYDPLFEELKKLEKNWKTGKIDHPSQGAKDSADAVCGVVAGLIEAAAKQTPFVGNHIPAMEDINDESWVLDGALIPVEKVNSSHDTNAWKDEVAAKNPQGFTLPFLMG